VTDKTKIPSVQKTSSKKDTPEAMKDKIAQQLRQARRSSLESKVKDKMEKLIKAEEVVDGINDEIDQLFEENVDLFDDA
jgi:hypothetical protein